MKDIFYLSIYYMFKGMIWILPHHTLQMVAKGLANMVFSVDKKHQHIARVNLDLAYGDTISSEEKEQIVKKTYLNLVWLLIDFIQNQGIDKEKLLEKVSFENEEIFQSALKEKKNIILMTAHYGNWELLPLSIAARFGPLTGVGRKIDSEAINRILNQNREQFNIKMLDKKGALRDMMAVLKQKRILGLLVDQNTSQESGILVNFFDKPVRHTPSAAILARRYNALIIPAFISTEDYSTYKVKFYEPIMTAKTEDKDRDILDAVQQQAAITEEVIRQKPEEWFWLHQRWKNQFEERYK